MQTNILIFLTSLVSKLDARCPLVGPAMMRMPDPRNRQQQPLRQRLRRGQQQPRGPTSEDAARKADLQLKRATETLEGGSRQNP